MSSTPSDNGAAKCNQGILLTDVVTGYDRKSPLGGPFNAGIATGALTCLLGPNGAGKSTLLKTVAGFMNSLEGSIYLMGNKVTGNSAEGNAKLLSVVLTDKIPAEQITVYELVSLGRSPYTGFWGRLSKDDREAVENALVAVGIQDMAHRRVASLSDGERQKTLIAKAVAQNTPILLLDEPTAFLDYPGKAAVMHLLASIAKKQGKTVFLSTHDLEIALQIADCIWLLDRKHGLRTGNPEELISSGAIEQYFGSEHMEFNPATRSFHIKPLD